MKGNPKFHSDQRVKFTVAGKTLEGNIYIIDPYGTWGYDEDVSYDIMVESENCLYKHIPEKYVEEVVEEKNTINSIIYPTLENQSKNVPMTKEAFVEFAFAAAKAVLKRDEFDEKFDELLCEYGRNEFNGRCAYDLFGNVEAALIDTLIKVMNDDSGYICDYIYGTLDWINEIADEDIKKTLGEIYDDIVKENF